MAAAALVIIASLPAGSPWLGVLAFGLAGLGCSALLPLTISFGQNELTTIGASVAGGLIAFYQIGYGIAAFGVGPLDERAGLSLHAILRRWPRSWRWPWRRCPSSSSSVRHPNCAMHVTAHSTDVAQENPS